MVQIHFRQRITNETVLRLNISCKALELRTIVMVRRRPRLPFQTGVFLSVERKTRHRSLLPVLLSTQPADR